jgi:hypothetical protein
LFDENYSRYFFLLRQKEKKNVSDFFTRALTLAGFGSFEKASFLGVDDDDLIFLVDCCLESSSIA